MIQINHWGLGSSAQVGSKLFGRHVAVLHWRGDHFSDISPGSSIGLVTLFLGRVETLGEGTPRNIERRVVSGDLVGDRGLDTATVRGFVLIGLGVARERLRNYVHDAARGHLLLGHHLLDSLLSLLLRLLNCLFGLVLHLLELSLLLDFYCLMVLFLFKFFDNLFLNSLLAALLWLDNVHDNFTGSVHGLVLVLLILLSLLACKGGAGSDDGIQFIILDLHGLNSVRFCLYGDCSEEK